MKTFTTICFGLIIGLCFSLFAIPDVDSVVNPNNIYEVTFPRPFRNLRQRIFSRFGQRRQGTRFQQSPNGNCPGGNCPQSDGQSNEPTTPAPIITPPVVAATPAPVIVQPQSIPDVVPDVTPITRIPSSIAMHNPSEVTQMEVKRRIPQPIQK